MISLSKPRPKPLWGTEPKRRRSRYLAANWPTAMQLRDWALCATVFCPELRSTTSSLLALSPSQWSACQGHPTSSQHLLKLRHLSFKKKLANVFPDTFAPNALTSLSSRWEPPMTWKKLHIHGDPVRLFFIPRPLQWLVLAHPWPQQSCCPLMPNQLSCKASKTWIFTVVSPHVAGYTTCGYSSRPRWASCRMPWYPHQLANIGHLETPNSFREPLQLQKWVECEGYLWVQGSLWVQSFWVVVQNHRLFVDLANLICGAFPLWSTSWFASEIEVTHLELNQSELSICGKIRSRLLR